MSIIAITYILKQCRYNIVTPRFKFTMVVMHQLFIDFLQKHGFQLEEAKQISQKLEHVSK